MSISAELFLVSNIKDLYRDGDLTIFDYSLKNALLFSQGDWSLIERDLLYAGIDTKSIEALTDETKNGPCLQILAAFNLRTELINYKKVCLHLFEEANRIERDLKQALSFFFWYDGDDPIYGSRAHIDALRSLLLVPTDTVYQENWMRYDDIREAVERHSDHGACTMKDRKLLYTLASGTWMFHRGILRAINDARDVVKAICLSPRHPDGELHGERPIKLQTLPHSMLVHQIGKKAEKVLQEKYRSRCPHDSALNANVVSYNQQYSTIKTHVRTRGVDALNCILENVRTELSWTPDAVDFLSKSIIARGGFKALAIVEELQNYKYHLEQLIVTTEDILKRYKQRQSAIFETLYVEGLLDEKFTVDDGSEAIRYHKEIHHLGGAIHCLRENSYWVTALLSSLEGKNGTKQRIFVTGDNSGSNNSCSFLPREFQLGKFVMASRRILDDILSPTMRVSMLNESWPPKLGSRRRRVVAYDEETLKSASTNVGKRKLQRCKDCDGQFANIWIRHSLCFSCESYKRDSRVLDECIFENCTAGPGAFCIHSRRCFHCDASHSCEQLCRLSKGNGEFALNLVESIRPKLLLLDFDRTLCSTKSGASPLPTRKQMTTSMKDKRVHSVDQDLKLAILATQAFGTSHIVTRNSHKLEIEQFLRLNGLVVLTSNVHVVPKKVTKGSYIKEAFFKCEEDSIRNAGTKCLFIDDSLAELINDPWLREAPYIHRLLFVR